MSSGAATTTNPNDLIFGAGASSVSSPRSAAASPHAPPPYGNLTEDKNVTSAGSNTATATQVGNGWVMHMVAFGPPTSDTVPPSVPTGLVATPFSTSQINLAWNQLRNVSIAGYKVYRNGTWSPRQRPRRTKTQACRRAPHMTTRSRVRRGGKQLAPSPQS